MNGMEFRRWFNDNYHETLKEPWTDEHVPAPKICADLGDLHFELKQTKTFRYSIKGPHVKSGNVQSDHVSCVIFEQLWKVYVKEA